LYPTFYLLNQKKRSRAQKQLFIDFFLKITPKSSKISRQSQKSAKKSENCAPKAPFNVFFRQEAPASVKKATPAAQKSHCFT
jgi:hypothetical protein